MGTEPEEPKERPRQLTSTSSILHTQQFPFSSVGSERAVVTRLAAVQGPRVHEALLRRSARSCEPTWNSLAREVEGEVVPECHPSKPHSCSQPQTSRWRVTVQRTARRGRPASPPRRPSRPPSMTLRPIPPMRCTKRSAFRSASGDPWLDAVGRLGAARCLLQEDQVFATVDCFTPLSLGPFGPSRGAETGGLHSPHLR